MNVNFSAWEDHAAWWEAEAPRVRERFGVNDATLEDAERMFGKIGSSVGQAYQQALAARRDLGESLGRYAQNVAAHIRSDLGRYADTEQDNRRLLGAPPYLSSYGQIADGVWPPLGPGDPAPGQTHPAGG